MSRVGNKSVVIPSNVKVAFKDGVVNVEGGKEKLSFTVPSLVEVSVKDSELSVARKSESRQARAMQGTTRSIINNMVVGVTKGFKKELSIVGVGYRAQVAGSKLTLFLGYSHPVVYEIPKGVKVTVEENTKVFVEGADKHLVGEVSATIRRFRPPEPYKGKGVRYVDEHITMKEGKSVG